MKDPRVEKPKSRAQKLKVPASQRFTNNAEICEQAWKEKKKNEKWERRNRERGPQNSTSTTEANSTSTGKEKSKWNGSNRRDPSQITYWNCSKKGHYADKSLKPPKSKNYCESAQPPRQWLVLIRRLRRWSLTGSLVSITRFSYRRIKR